MPLFALHAIDRPGTLPLRMEHHAEHRAFLETGLRQGVSVVLSGPLQSDDGETMTGSFFLIEAPDRATIEAFAQADPFAKAGVWGEVKINRFHRRMG